MLPFSFTLRPPRHPLLRAVLALAGLALLGFFAVFGVVVAAFVLLGLGLRRALLQAQPSASPTPAPRAADPHVIEGEFSVVHKPHTGLPLR